MAPDQLAQCNQNTTDEGIFAVSRIDGTGSSAVTDALNLASEA
jgi:hypothetical protein